MTGKELVLQTFRHEETPRLPWVPFAGIHAGKLKGYTAKEVLLDGDKLFEALMEVNRLYMPDGQPVAFDLQLEAEILGCELMWADDNPPSVRTHPLANVSEIPERMIQADEGRISLIMEVTRRLKEAVGDQTAVFGLFCGPLTLASHLRGTSLFTGMRKAPDHVRAIINYATANAMRMIDFYAEAGADVIAPVDPVVSQISPKNFREFLSEPYERLFEYIREKGLASSFFVCGNAINNIEEMCLTKPDGISIDENIPMASAKAITDRYNVAIGGNIPLTTTMLFGNQQDNMKFVLDMIDSVDKRNLIVAPGCDMPYDTPVENAIAVAELVRNVDTYRDVLKGYESVENDIDIELPDYEHLPRPLIEAFTLDSASCAACTYMWASARDAKKTLGEAIDIVEYKYTTHEGIARCKKMGVKYLPSIYINGELKYASQIPNQEEFVEEIKKLLI